MVLERSKQLLTGMTCFIPRISKTIINNHLGGKSFVDPIRDWNIQGATGRIQSLSGNVGTPEVPNPQGSWSW